MLYPSTYLTSYPTIHHQTVKVLLAHGASIALADASGDTPLHIAAITSQIPVLKVNLPTYLPYLPTYLPFYLSTIYLSTYLPTYLPTLCTYLSTYLPTYLQYLLDNKAPINALGENKRAPLFLAAYYGRYDSVRVCR